jgi:3-oxoacyl-[acyl-carrier-protein] synthase II
MRRVVVTGLGLVTPLATGVEETWSRLLAGQSGAGPITRFDASHLATTYACEVKRGDGTDGTFNPDDWMEPKEAAQGRRVHPLRHGRRRPGDQGRGLDARATTESLERTGCLIGSGIGGLSSIADTSITLNEKGPRRVSPFFVPGALINLISGRCRSAMASRGRTTRW